MTSKVVYNGSLRTTCTHLKSNTSFETDAPVDNNGKGERISPTDMLATSLGACMITVMGIKAETMGIELEGIEIEVLKTIAAEPRRVSAIDLFFHIPERLASLDEKSIKILKGTGETCPVAKSLHPDMAVNINWGAWS